MLGSLICTDTSKLEEFGFRCRTRCDGSKYYVWRANGVYDCGGFSDILVFEYSDGKTGWFRIDRLNKTSTLPKIVQLANAGLLKKL